MRALVASLALLLLLLAAAPAQAQPSPVGIYPCFNGGTTVVVAGKTLLTCFQGAEVERCMDGGVFVRVAGVILSDCSWGPPPP